MRLFDFNRLNNKNEIAKFYHNYGFVIIKNFFNTKLIKEVKIKINNKIKNSNNKFIYFEKINEKLKPRRIEKVSNFSTNSKKIINSKKIYKALFLLEKKKFVLFKDKLNFKYPGGEGYLPHIDGHFTWKNKLNKKQYGWKKYSSNFINLVIPLEKTYKKNGCLYIAKKSKSNFVKILSHLNKHNFTIKKNFIKKIKFFPVELDRGDVCFFNWKCAHFSKKNYSNKSRMIFYVTYCLKNNLENVRTKYYLDKRNSKNTDEKKSLLYN